VNTSANKPTILVVDDERPVAEMLAVALEQAGYDVIQAESAADVVSVCTAAEQQIDLILSDFEMPGLNGSQLAQRLRVIRPDIKIVFMSGNPDARERLMAEGHICLAKPFLLSELYETLHSFTAEK
jgi:CheY-like chemotaxis protein